MVFYHGYEVGVWYVAESAEGTTPTNAAFLHLAHKTEVVISDQAKPTETTKSGSVDFAALGKGVDNPVATITFNPSSANGKAFLKNYASSDTSFSLLVMIDAGSDTIFGRITGCKVKRISPKCSIYPEATPVSVTAEIWGWGPILFTASAGTPTFEAAPSSIVNWSDVTFKKDTVTLTKWFEWDWTLDNKLERIPASDGSTSGIKRGTRDVTGSYTIPAEDVGSTELNENKNATAVDINILLGADDYAFADCAMTTTEIPHPITGLVVKKMQWKATSYSVS